MNYQITLVIGDSASFFLSEWHAGGVEITDEVVGLFGVKPGRDEMLLDALDVYNLQTVQWNLTDLMKIGLSPHWIWKRVVWQRERESSSLRDAARKLEGLLGPGVYEDNQRKIRILQLVQAIYRREGLPFRIEGEVTGPGGRPDRVFVYPGGVVAYDRTPHPLPFLQAVAQVMTEKKRS